MNSRRGHGRSARPRAFHNSIVSRSFLLGDAVRHLSTIGSRSSWTLIITMPRREARRTVLERAPLIASTLARLKASHFEKLRYLKVAIGLLSETVGGLGRALTQNANEDRIIRFRLQALLGRSEPFQDISRGQNPEC